MKQLVIALGSLLVALSASAAGLDGKALYQQNCASCHGDKGKGGSGVVKGPALAGDSHACEAGVARTHLISRHIDGAILQELFSDIGIGSMVVESTLNTLRDATINDVGGILQLLQPLEAEGVLVRRGRERLEREIGRFVVLEHDHRIIGCAALYPFIEDQAAERQKAVAQ